MRRLAGIFVDLSIALAMAVAEWTAIFAVCPFGKIDPDAVPIRIANMLEVVDNREFPMEE